MRARINEEGGCRAYPLPAAFLGEHLGTFRQTRNGHDPVALALEFEDPNPLGVTADLTEFIHLASKHLAVSGHQHDLIAVSDLKKPDGESVALIGLHADDTLSPASLDAILVHRRAFSVAALRDREDLGGGVGGDGFHADDFVAFLKCNAAHPMRRAAHRAGVVFLEADRDALLRTQKDFPLAVGDMHADEPIPAIQRQSDDASL